MVRCRDCGLVRLDPQPDDAVLASIYDAAYFIGSEDEVLRAEANAVKRDTAKLQLSDIAACKFEIAPEKPPRMLEVGCGLGNFMVEARNAGFDVYGIDVSGSAVASANQVLGEERARAGGLEEAGFEEGSFDVVVLADVIEHVRDPARFVAHIRRLVKPDGLVFVATPSLDSLSARLMGRHWMEFKLEHLFYFDRRTLQRLLEEGGFEAVTFTPGRKVLSLGYVIGHFKRYPVAVFTPMMRFLGWILPQWLLRHRFRVVASGINAIARTGERAS